MADKRIRGRLFHLALAWLSIVPLSSAWSASKFVAVSAPSHAEQPAAARVKNFLGRVPLIRVGVASARGNGHQATSLVALRRLRELGFNGRFDVVYDPAVRDKLSRLLPGFEEAGPDIQTLSESGVTAIDRGFWDASGHGNRAETAALGLLGADDRGTFDNDALKSRAVLLMQPFLWGSPPYLFAKTTKKIHSTPFQPLQYLPLVYSLPDPENPARFILDRMASSPVRPKAKNLSLLARSLGRLELLPAYGLSMRDPESKIIRIVQAALLAQERMPHAFRGPAVLALFSSPGASAMDHVRRFFGQNDRLKDRVHLIGIYDSQFKKILNQARSRDVLVVETGAVPQEVFEFFFSQATLPATVAGANGENLMRLIGKPYLNTVVNHRVSLRTRYHPQNLDSDSEALLKEALNELQGEMPPGTPGDKIANFMLAALDPKSSLNLAFASLRPQGLADDKIFRLLEAVADIQEPLDWPFEP